VLAIAASGSLYGYFLIVGFRLGPVARLTQLEFLALPLAYIAGWVFFDEPLSLRKLAGR
jgi:drug/metabolite transporter (DMT)-like permease